MSYFQSLPPMLLICLGVVFSFLVIAQIIVMILQRAYPQRDFVELSQRVKSWWYMVIIFTIALLVSKNVSLIFLGLVSFIALKEFFSMIPTRRADRRVLFWAYITIPIQFYFAAVAWYGMFIIFIPVYMFLLIPTRMIILGETKDFLKAVGTIHWGLMTTVYCLSHASYLLTIETNVTLPSSNAGLLLFLVLLTQTNDIAQYMWGKLFGNRKIIPSISPGKTIVGFVGGVITTSIFSVAICTFLTPFSLLHGLIIGIIIGVSGFLGDVNISAIKRDIGVKDSGQLIPGHGGILDRVDSLTFTAPLFFHYLNYFYA